MTEPTRPMATIDKTDFGRTPAGRDNTLYTLARPGGLRARIATLGACVVSLEVPDRAGRVADVVLGYDDLAGYLDNRVFFGGIIGRYANRIARGELPIGGAVHRLATNNGAHHLHGGPGGFHTVAWDVVAADTGAAALTLAYTSRDGDEGYPGTLHVEVTYALTAAGALRIDYAARAADRPTAVNLTHHSYFNLAGDAAGPITDHRLRLAASHFLPTDAGLIPTGELRPVRGTPFDFLAATAIGARIDVDDADLRLGSGYDHCFALDAWDGSLRDAAELVDPASGRRLLLRTTEPGLQLYSGNHLRSIPGKHGVHYAPRTGLCLEPQHFPDSPHHPTFPSTLLSPGDTYRQTTEYVFSSS